LKDFLQEQDSRRVFPKATVLYNLPESDPLVLTNSIIVAFVFLAVPILYIWIMMVRIIGDRSVITNCISNKTNHQS
jgi:hypothetical protein